MSTNLRIREVRIRNYKGIDRLDLVFPGVLMTGDADVCVLGSRNGVGKTSLLECCALLVAAGEGRLECHADGNDSVVRGGTAEAVIEGTLVRGGKEKHVTVRIKPGGEISTGPVQTRGAASRRVTLNEVLGEQVEPVFTDSLIYIHGFRKIREAGLNLGTILRSAPDGAGGAYASCTGRLPIGIYPYAYSFPVSSFKLSILKYLLGSADLFRGGAAASDSQVRETLGALLEAYASVALDKLRPHDDNTIDIMVRQLGDENVIFPIDGLSSGQKEVISMLFMVWDATRVRPHVVLIDEPELHLNAEWHKLFVNQLTKLAPHNQYILATHSEQIMSAVEPEARVLLQRTPEKGNVQ